MRKLILSITLFLSAHATNAQNCTVNAGVDKTYCVNDSISLTAFRAGSLSGGSTWTQVSGPSVIISSPNSLNTAITGKVAGTMVFNIRNRCSDGSNANDQVSITMLGVTPAKAGPDFSLCPGTDTLQGNTPGSGETGTWSIISNTGSVSVLNVNNSQSLFTANVSNGGVSTLRWSISNSNGCGSFDEMTITNYGGAMPVTLADSVTLSPCYSVFQSTILTGSASGVGFGGQNGSWSTISGPSIPLLNFYGNTANVSNLIQGVYKFKYVVSGPCANGVDSIQVRVPAPLGELSPNTGQTFYLCDRPKTLMLNASPPIYRNDTCSWIQTSGPSTVSFNPVNSANTTVSNLRAKAGDVYQFQFIMANPVSGCRSSSIFYIQYVDTPQLNVFPDRVLNCDQDTAFIRWKYTGGMTTTVTQLIGPKNATVGTFLGVDTTSNYTSISNLDSSGIYIFQVTRSSGSGQSCVSVQDEIKLVVSIQPGAANAGSAQRLNCNVDTTELAGNIPSPGIGTWYQNSGPDTSSIDDSTSNITAVRKLIAGKYSYRWLINGGQACYPTQDDVDVLVADTIPNVAAGGTDQTICFQSVLHLQGNQPNAGSSGVWKAIPDSGLAFTDSTSYITNVTGMDSAKTYLFVWKVYNSCGFNTDTVAVTTTTDIAAIPADAGNDRCLPDTTSFFFLDGNKPWPGTGHWTKISGPSDSIVSDTSYNAKIIPSGPGTYKYQWSIGNSLCQSGNDTVVITLSDSVTQAFAGLNKDTCSNNLVLRGNQPVYGQGHWSLSIGQINGDLLYPDSFSTPVLNLNQGTYIYRWTIDNGACGLSSDDVKVNIANPTTVPVTTVGKVWCNPGSISINANRITKGKSYWSLYGSNPTKANFNPKDSANTTVSNLSAGIYTFKWNSINPMGICPDLYAFRSDTIVFNADAGGDRYLCKQYNIILYGTTNSTGYWRQLSGDTATLDTLGPNSVLISQLSSSGSPYKFIYEVSPAYTCANIRDTMEIQVFDSTRTPYAGLDQNLCDADTFHLNANSVSPDNGSWSQYSGPNTGTFGSTANPVTTFYNIVGGSYLLRWKSSNLACEQSDFVLIRNYDSSATANAGNDTTICPPGGQLHAIFNSSNSTQWLQISGPNTATINSGVDPQTRIDNLVKGVYQFEWTVNNGYCPASKDTVAITIAYDQPSNAFAGNDTTLCKSDTFTMRANNPIIGKGSWAQIAGTSSNLVDDTLYNTSIYNLDTGRSVYVWTVTNGNCSDRDTSNIRVDDLPSQALADADSGYCLYTVVELNALRPGKGTGSWQQINGSGANILSPNDSNTLVSGLNAGQYHFTWSVANGVCPPTKDTVNVEIDSIPSLSDAGPDINTCLGVVKMNAQKPGSGIGEWHWISGIDTAVVMHPNSDSSTVYGLDSGKYTYEWEVARGGCKSFDTMQIILEDPDSNDQCIQPTDVYDPGGIFNGDLCGTKTFGAEPNTFGYSACNTIFYRFHTSSYSYSKNLQIDILSRTNCSYPLRLSLFDSGSCPGLGVQRDTTIIATSTGSFVFDSLKTDWGYILVIDEYRIPCAKSECKLQFRIGGNALPIEIVQFDVKPISKGKAEILWKSSDDRQIVKYLVKRIQGEQISELAEVSSNRSEGISQYSIIDPGIYAYPVVYELWGMHTDGTWKSLGSRILYSSGLLGELRAYPNPSTGNFRLQYEGENSYRLSDIRIYDAYGKQVYKAEKIRLSELPDIYTGDWAGGMYVVCLNVGDRVYSISVSVLRE